MLGAISCSSVWSDCTHGTHDQIELSSELKHRVCVIHILSALWPYPHLTSLPKGFTAVSKELRRLHGLGWYDFHPQPAFYPGYFNAQGSQARKLPTVFVSS